MSLLVVVLLAVLWAAVLLPGALRGRRDASPMTSIDSFERTMWMLAHRAQTPPGRQVLMPPPSDPARARAARRRRLVLSRMAAATGGTALLALLAGGAAWFLFAASAAALGGYVAVLYQDARRRELRRKVRHLHRSQLGGRRVLDLEDELATAEQGGR